MGEKLLSANSYHGDEFILNQSYLINSNCLNIDVALLKISYLIKWEVRPQNLLLILHTFIVILQHIFY